MPLNAHGWPTTNDIAKELTRCRWRGLDRLDLHDPDRDQLRVEAAHLTELAWKYCTASNLEQHDRIAQITQLLRDGLAVYSRRGYQKDSNFIRSLFFDQYGEVGDPGDLLDKARTESGYKGSAFDRRRREKFTRFAQFLIDYVDEVTRRDMSPIPTHMVAPSDVMFEFSPVVIDHETIRNSDINMEARAAEDDRRTASVAMDVGLFMLLLGWALPSWSAAKSDTSPHSPASAVPTPPQATRSNHDLLEQYLIGLYGDDYRSVVYATLRRLFETGPEISITESFRKSEACCNGDTSCINGAHPFGHPVGSPGVSTSRPGCRGKNPTGSSIVEHVVGNIAVLMIAFGGRHYPV